STLGRETCLQAAVFDDEGWLRLRKGGHHAHVDVEVDVEVEADSLGASASDACFVDDFDGPLDSRTWTTLRAAIRPDVADLHSRPGWLRLRGGHSAASVFDQSMLLTRVTEHRTSAEVVVDAQPRTTREAAGLIAWYDRRGWIWLQVTWDEQNG